MKVTGSSEGSRPHDPVSLAQTLRRLCAQLDIDRVEPGDAHTGWFTAARLTRPDSVLLPGLLEIEGRRVGSDRRTRAAFLIEQTAGLLGTVAGLLYLGADRVPDLHPEAVALRLEPYTWTRRGGVTGPGLRLRLRLLRPEFHVLPARHESIPVEARPVDGREALRDRLREQLHDHLAPLVSRLRDCTRLSPGAQWRLAADAIAAVFLDLGRRLDGESRARAEALALLKAPDSPLANPHTGYMEVRVADREGGILRRTFRVRGGCCRIYTCDGGGYCSTCVLEPHESRYRRLQASLGA